MVRVLPGGLCDLPPSNIHNEVRARKGLDLQLLGAPVLEEATEAGEWPGAFAGRPGTSRRRPLNVRDECDRGNTRQLVTSGADAVFASPAIDAHGDSPHTAGFQRGSSLSS